MPEIKPKYLKKFMAESGISLGALAKAMSDRGISLSRRAWHKYANGESVPPPKRKAAIEAEKFIAELEGRAYPGK